MKRKVATKDAQPCIICQRMATTVLFNASGPDWIYTCDLHLEDNPQFATPVYPSEYNTALQEMKLCQTQLAQIKDKRDGKGGSWDNWINTMFTKKQAGKKEKNDTTDKDTDNAVSNSEETEQDPASLERELQVKYDKALETMSALQKQRKTFTLSDKMFEYRLLRRKQQRLRAQQQLKQQEQLKKEQESYTDTDPADLEAKFNFPTVPKNNLS